MTLQETLRLHASWLEGNAEGRRADLTGANLVGADLSGANLVGADLRRADLTGADLSGADLMGADLSDADLSDADLRRANLAGADLSGAKGLYELDMADPRGYRPVAVAHADGWRIASGCRWFTVADALAHWSDSTHNHPDIAARYVRTIHNLPSAEDNQ